MCRTSSLQQPTTTGCAQARYLIRQALQKVRGDNNTFTGESRKMHLDARGNGPVATTDAEGTHYTE